MIDFNKYKVGDIVSVFVCDDCANSNMIKPKFPPDSGNESWLCRICEHFGIGSTSKCEITNWLSLKPLKKQIET